MLSNNKLIIKTIILSFLIITSFTCNFIFNNPFLKTNIYEKNNKTTSSINAWDLLPIGNLIGFWNFNDGTADDSSGNNFDGIPQFDASSDINGYKGTGAFKFAYSLGSRVDVPYSATQDVTSEITLMAWVYPTAWDNWANRIISKQPLYLLRGNFGRAEFQISTTTYGSQSIIDTSSSLSVNNWHFIVGTFDGQNLNLYVDGILKKTTNLGSVDTILTNSSDIYISTNSAVGEGFTGKIDEVSIWNKAIPGSLVQMLYNQ